MTPEERAAHIVELGRLSNSADATGEVGTIRVAGTASSTTVTIPEGLKGKYVRILSRGVNTQLGITVRGSGGSAAPTAPTLVFNQLSAFGTGHQSAAQTFADGVVEHFWIPLTAYQLVYIMDIATGFLEVTPSSRRADARA